MAGKSKGNIVLGGSAVIFVVMVAMIFLWPVLFPKTYEGDYPGPGEGEATITIPEGSNVNAIGTILQENDVVSSADIFVAVASDKEATDKFQAGVFNMKFKMSAAGAVECLLDPNSVAKLKITIPEGWTVKQILAYLNELIGVPLEDLQAALDEVAAEKLPESANQLTEGWLFPETYLFDLGSSPQTIFATLIDQTIKILTANEVAPADWETVLIKASIVQIEVGPQDFAKVARVIENRLNSDVTEHMLQMDAITAYGLGIPGTELTQSQLDDPSNPYNMRVLPGLPPGPISNPSEAAIQAVLNPEPGDWVWFVTVNLDTGETKFTDNFAEFEIYKAEYLEWLAKNS